MGPWAGPVVAAAVMLIDPPLAARDGAEWLDLGARIEDSKRLSALQRERAEQLIRRHAIVGVGIVSADHIDERNILQATLCAMSQAVADLSCAPELILIDGLHAPALPAPHRTIVDGDRYSYSIACASIIAKVLRDSLMRFYHRLFPEHRFDQHKGYGTADHQRSLRDPGPCALHRFSFEPVRAAHLCAMSGLSPADHADAGASQPGPASQSDERVDGLAVAA